MKRVYLLLSFIIIYCFNAGAQTVVRIFLDNNLPVTTVINDTKFFNVELKLQKYKKAKKLVLKIDNNKNSVFKHSLELTNERDSVLYKVEENSKAVNQFDFDVKKLRMIAKNNMKAQLVLIEEPTNPQMRIRSKSTVLMNIHFY